MSTYSLFIRFVSLPLSLNILLSKQRAVFREISIILQDTALFSLICSRVPGVIIFKLKKALRSISVGPQEWDFIESYSQGQACGKSCYKLAPTIVLFSRPKKANK